MPRQSVRRHNVLGQNVRRDKTRLMGQNIRRDKTYSRQNVHRDKTSRDINIRGTKCLWGQNVHRDKASGDKTFVWVIFLGFILGNIY